MPLQSSTTTTVISAATPARKSHVEHTSSSECLEEVAPEAEEEQQTVDWTLSTTARQATAEATKSLLSISTDRSYVTATTMSSSSSTARRASNSASSSQKDLLIENQQVVETCGGANADTAVDESVPMLSMVEDEKDEDTRNQSVPGQQKQDNDESKEKCNDGSMSQTTPYKHTTDTSDGDGQEKQQRRIESKLSSSPMSTPKRNSRKRHDIFFSVVNDEDDEDDGDIKFNGSSSILGGSLGHLILSPVNKKNQSTGSNGIRNHLASPIRERDIRTGISYYGDTSSTLGGGDVDGDSMVFTDIAISSERDEDDDDDGDNILSSSLSPRRSPRSKIQSNSPTSILGIDNFLQAAKETIPSFNNKTSKVVEMTGAASNNNMTVTSTTDSNHKYSDQIGASSTMAPPPDVIASSSPSSSFSIGHILRKSWLANIQNRQEQQTQQHQEQQTHQPQQQLEQRHSMSWWISKQDRKTLAQRVSEVTAALT